jgi:hypothetical protein
MPEPPATFSLAAGLGHTIGAVLRSAGEGVVDQNPARGAAISVIGLYYAVGRDPEGVRG